MAGISDAGGAERYWRRLDTGERLVLCRDGSILLKRRGGHWQTSSYTRDQVEADPTRWQPDTRRILAGAVTRTARQARRQGGA